ncbi:MAG: DEAD/DEAH box helicase family protein [Planktomarina sp.]
MHDPFAQMAFCYPWRAYQQTVLDDLQTHLSDRKLHVCAAPGAGKTVLGLEVVRRLAKPTLILAPSLAIKTQWIDRLVELFLSAGANVDWVSSDLRQPALVTVTTYQALHMHSDPVALQALGVEVVVLDEAHHLRKSWWDALNRVVTALDAKTVSLTATPPYDVAATEWQRYNALCGPLDAEISIPELVKTGDLAPHQDLVHLSHLHDETAYLCFDQQNADLRAGAVNDADLCAMLLDHPWVKDTQKQTEAVLSDPKLFSAMLVYLAHAGHDIPKNALRVLGVRQKYIPLMSDDWLEYLFQAMLDDLPDSLIRHLTRHSAISRGRVSIPVKDSDDRDRMLRNASEKYFSIRDIVRAERDSLQCGLRMAVLTEYVGAQAIKLAAGDPQFYQADTFQQHAAANPKLGQISAGTVFERLRLEPDQPADLAVLTGSLCIVPTGSLKGDGINAKPLPHDPRYDALSLTGAASGNRVKLVSGLIQAGTVRVLIGTRSLLGQGWDAPSINTLILATNVKSFVSSNQIRGRAIRRDPADPNKAANIWHIATIAPNADGPEVEALNARFDTFVHLDRTDGEIRSGFDAFADRDAINANALAQAKLRSCLAHDWTDALVRGTATPRIRHQIETRNSTKGLVRKDALYRSAPRVGIAGALATGWATLSGDPVMGGLALGAGLFVTAPVVSHTKRLIQHGSLQGSLRQTGLALLHAMVKAKQIRTPRDQLDVRVGRTKTGAGYCALTGATLQEETRFIAMLEEFFAPIENPRYLLIRKGYMGRFVQFAPYAVPTELGRHKTQAQDMLDGWNRHVGPAALIYTRTVFGRQALLQARTISLVDTRHATRRSVWT